MSEMILTIWITLLSIWVLILSVMLKTLIQWALREIEKGKGGEWE